MINDKIDAVIKRDANCGIDSAEVLKALPSAQQDLIDKIQNGINATNANDSYSCGMRNGMRWCMSLVDDKEPSFEECPSAQPEIIRCKDCKHRPKATRADEKVFYGFSVEFPDEKCPCYCEDGWYGWYPDDDFYCGYAERRTDE